MLDRLLPDFDPRRPEARDEVRRQHIARRGLRPGAGVDLQALGAGPPAAAEGVGVQAHQARGPGPVAHRRPVGEGGLLPLRFGDHDRHAPPLQDGGDALVHVPGELVLLVAPVRGAVDGGGPVARVQAYDIFAHGLLLLFRRPGRLVFEIDADPVVDPAGGPDDGPVQIALGRAAPVQHHGALPAQGRELIPQLLGGGGVRRAVPGAVEAQAAPPQAHGAPAPASALARRVVAGFLHRPPGADEAGAGDKIAPVHEGGEPDIRPPVPAVAVGPPGDGGDQLPVYFEQGAGRAVRVPHAAVENIVGPGGRLDGLEGLGAAAHPELDALHLRQGYIGDALAHASAASHAWV